MRGEIEREKKIRCIVGQQEASYIIVWGLAYPASHNMNNVGPFLTHVNQSDGLQTCESQGKPSIASSFLSYPGDKSWPTGIPKKNSHLW
jgi:hypothetical protein